MRSSVFLLSALAALGVTQSHAQQYPARSITIVVAFPAGGGHDFTARTIASRLSPRLGQQVVVENRPGANGQIGAQHVSRAAPDGHTMLLASPAELVISQSLYKNLPYDGLRDFSAVTLAGVSPITLIAHPSTQVKTPQDLIRAAKSKAAQLSYGTPGAGSAQHLAGAWIAKLGGVEWIHVPYKGAAPVVTDTLGGQIPFGLVGIAPAMPHIKSGRFNAVAVMAPKRLTWLPSIPAIGEVAALKPIELVQWMGVVMPAKTPPAVVDRMHREIRAVLQDAETSRLMIDQGVEPADYAPRAFAAFLEAEHKKYAYLVKLSGATVE